MHFSNLSQIALPDMWFLSDSLSDFISQRGTDKRWGILNCFIFTEWLLKFVVAVS